jgi:hypothetical protein
MRDSDQEYPLHQPRGNGRHHIYDDDTEDDGDSLQKPVHPGRGPFHQREAPSSPQLPRGYFNKALIIGAIAGALAALQIIIVTLANASLYHTVSTTPQDKLSLSLAGAVFGLTCLTVFISVIIYFIAGFIIGKVAVARRVGFIGGFVAGAVTSILWYVVQQFPGYPDARSTGFSGGLLGLGGGLITALIILTVLGTISGLVSLVGAWLATRRHPYYYVQ